MPYRLEKIFQFFGPDPDWVDPPMDLLEFLPEDVTRDGWPSKGITEEAVSLGSIPPIQALALIRKLATPEDEVWLNPILEDPEKALIAEYLPLALALVRIKRGDMPPEEIVDEFLATLTVFRRGPLGACIALGDAFAEAKDKARAREMYERAYSASGGPSEDQDLGYFFLRRAKPEAILPKELDPTPLWRLDYTGTFSPVGTRDSAEPPDAEPDPYLLELAESCYSASYIHAITTIDEGGYKYEEAADLVLNQLLLLDGLRVCFLMRGRYREARLAGRVCQCWAEVAREEDIDVPSAGVEWRFARTVGHIEGFDRGRDIGHAIEAAETATRAAILDPDQFADDLTARIVSQLRPAPDFLRTIVENDLKGILGELWSRLSPPVRDRLFEAECARTNMESVASRVGAIVLYVGALESLVRESLGQELMLGQFLRDVESGRVRLKGTTAGPEFIGALKWVYRRRNKFSHGDAKSNAVPSAVDVLAIRENVLEKPGSLRILATSLGIT